LDIIALPAFVELQCANCVRTFDCLPM